MIFIFYFNITIKGTKMVLTKSETLEVSAKHLILRGQFPNTKNMLAPNVSAAKSKKSLVAQLVGPLSYPPKGCGF